MQRILLATSGAKQSKKQMFSCCDSEIQYFTEFLKKEISMFFTNLPMSVIALCLERLMVSIVNYNEEVL